MIAEVSDEQITRMKEFLENTKITVEHVDNGITFEIIVTLKKGDSYSQVRIANYHTNIVHIEKDHKVLLDIPVEGESEEGLTDRSLRGYEGYLGLYQHGRGG